MYSKVIGLFFLFFVTWPVKNIFSQSTVNDSLAIKKGKEYALNFYGNAMEGTHHLYNGREYVAYQPQRDEHPYFIMDDWAFGSLTYDGYSFSQIPMLLDIASEQLVISHYYNGAEIILVNEKVKDFEISGHLFININDGDSLSANGFYELLYNGEIKLVAKHTKQLVRKFVFEREERSFNESTRYFLIRDGRFIQVKNKRSFLNEFDDSKEIKSNVRTYIDRNHLFKNDIEPSMIAVVKYYAGLRK